MVIAVVIIMVIIMNRNIIMIIIIIIKTIAIKIIKSFLITMIIIKSYD